MVLGIEGIYSKEKYLNNILLLLCVMLFLFSLSNLNNFFILFLIDVSILLLIFVLIFFFRREAHRYCFIVSFPTVFTTILLLNSQNRYLDYLELMILSIILAFFLIFSLRIFTFSSRIYSKLFYAVSPIGPLIFYLSRLEISTSIFENIFLVILSTVFLVSFFLYSYEFPFFIQTIRKRFVPFKSEVAYSDGDVNLPDVGEILSFFIFQIALIQCFFDLNIVTATIFCMYVLFSMNNYLRFEIGIDFKPLMEFISIVFTLLVAGLLLYYWKNIKYFSVLHIFSSISLLFFLISLSIFVHKKNIAPYRIFFEKLSDLDFLFAPIFLSIIIYGFEYEYTTYTFIGVLEYDSLVQAILTGLITVAGMVLTIYIPMAILLIGQRDKARSNSSHKILLIISPIILSFSLRCCKLIDRVVRIFLNVDPVEISSLVCQINYTIIMLMIAALSIVFLVYKYREMDQQPL